MKLDFGEVLRRVWKIGWNHKVLWLWQASPAAAVIFILPLFFVFYPFFIGFIQDPEFQFPVEPWMSIFFNSIVGLFVFSFTLLWIFSQITTIYGVVDIENGMTNISIKGLFHKSLPYFWRVIFLYFLYCSIWVLISVSFNPIIATIIRSYPDTINFLLRLLTLPLAFFSLVIMMILELSQIAIVTDNMSVIAAVSHAWKIFKSNLLNIAILGIIIYFGIYIPLGLSFLPVPFLGFISVLFLTRLPDPSVVFFMMFFVVVPLIIVLPTILAGIFMTFLQSTWVVAYLRMNKNLNDSMNLEKPPTEVAQ